MERPQNLHYLLENSMRPNIQVTRTRLGWQMRLTRLLILLVLGTTLAFLLPTFLLTEKFNFSGSRISVRPWFMTKETDYYQEGVDYSYEETTTLRATTPERFVFRMLPPSAFIGLNNRWSYNTSYKEEITEKAAPTKPLPANAERVPARVIKVQFEKKTKPEVTTKPPKIIYREGCLNGAYEFDEMKPAAPCDFKPSFLPMNKPEDPKLAKELALWLKKKYLKTVHKHFQNLANKKCPSTKVIQYNCNDYWTYCGGFGDRSRGLVSLFYFALLSNRLFDIRWDIPLDLNYYFKTNSAFYEIDSKLYGKVLNSTKTKDLAYMDSAWELDYYALTSNKVHEDPDLLKVDRLAILTNSLFGIVGLMHNKRLKNNLCRYFGEFEGYKRSPENFTNAVLVSAALRVLFSEPVRDFKAEVRRVLKIKAPLWLNSTRIGVQIRMENPEWAENARVSFDQVNCFVYEVKNLIKEHRIKKPLVFITSDNVNATAELLNLFEQAKIPAFEDDLHEEPAHIDRNSRMMKGIKARRGKQSPEAIWQTHVRSFVDWALLTRADYLLISRSGFGESASQYSLAPTRRFVHGLKDQSKCLFQDYKIFGHLRMEFNLYDNQPMGQ